MVGVVEGTCGEEVARKIVLDGMRLDGRTGGAERVAWEMMLENEKV